MPWFACLLITYATKDLIDLKNRFNRQLQKRFQPFCLFSEKPYNTMKMFGLAVLKPYVDK